MQLGQQARQLGQPRLAQIGRLVWRHSLAQGIDEEGVSQRLLHIGTLGAQGDGLIGHLCEQFLNQPRLANARLSLDQHQLPHSFAGPPPGLAQARHLRCPAHQRSRKAWPGGSFVDWRCNRPGRAKVSPLKLEAPRLDGLGQSGRLFHRLDAQFGVQYLAALGILGQGRLAFAQTGVGPHQGPIPILAQIVQAQQLMRGLDHSRIVAAVFALLKLSRQRILVAAPQPLAFEEGPVLEAVGVPDVKPLQKIALVCIGLARFQGGHVQPVVAFEIEADLLSLSQEVIVSDGAAQFGQGPAQRGPRIFRALK